MLPPLTHESKSRHLSRLNSFSFRNTPRWKAAARKPPPDRKTQSQRLSLTYGDHRLSPGSWRSVPIAILQGEGDHPQ